MSLGQILAAHIERRGCTKTWLARQCDVRVATISDAVHGRSNPGVELRTAICRALELSAEDQLALMQAPGGGA